MLCGVTTASHTLKKGKYKVTVSDKTYNKIKKGNKYFVKKVGTKKVTKWKTKKMKTYQSWIDANGNLYKSKSWNPYQKWGYKIKYVKSVTKYYDDGEITWDYYKVPTKVKKPLYLTAAAVLSGSYENPKPTGKIHIEITTKPYSGAVY